MLQKVERTELMKLASETARDAGQLLRVERDAYRVVEDLSGRDLKIRGDRETDDRIRKRLLHATAFPVLSEESPSTLDPLSNAGPLWIVDPLDGSVNYARGLELGCVSIALWEDGTPRLGVIYDIHHDHLYTGDTREGAALDGSAVRVSAVKTPNSAVLVTGFPVQGNFSEKGILDFVSAAQRFKKVRMLGTAALSLAFVASGVLDAYQERDIRIWDIAAGVALVRAAGGLYDIRPGRALQTVHVLAANPDLLRCELLRLQNRGTFHGSE